MILAAYLFALLAAVVAVFQLALALGMPWGELTWGGRFPGRLPGRMRGVALFSMLLVLVFALIVLARAGIAAADWQEVSRWAIWGVVAYCVLGVLGNAATPSRKERILWLPVTLVLLVCSVSVALS